jgi:DNA mismatch repair protein MutL
LGGGIALIDQKAALRRIYYDQTLKNSCKNSCKSESQSLLIPLTLPCTKAESQWICDSLDLLNEIGFGIRELGKYVFIVDAYPSWIHPNDLPSTIKQIIEHLMETEDSSYVGLQKKEKLVRAACRLISPSSRLSREEAQNILERIITCDIPSQCPFGKSIGIYISPEQIGK